VFLPARHCFGTDQNVCFGAMSRTNRHAPGGSRLLLLAILALAPSGCTPSVIDGGFDSPMPASRLYAIERASRAGDTTAIRSIIEQLDSDDPAVRLMAIGALQRLTGLTYGYHHDDDLLRRRAASWRWRDAYEAGELTQIGASAAGRSDIAARKD
jgi:hypothetical protein